MLSSSHAGAAPARPRPPGGSRKARTLSANHPSQNDPPKSQLSPNPLYNPIAELPADALASSVPARATTMSLPASPAGGTSSDSLPPSPSPHQRTLQPSRSRRLNVFAADGSAAAQWSDDSRPGTPKPFRDGLKTIQSSVSSPASDEQFSALINVALANMASRRVSASHSGTQSAASGTGAEGAQQTLQPLADFVSSDLDADHIGGLSRAELEALLVAANRKIMERERDIAIAAQIGRTLVEKHDSIKARHDGILRALATSSRGLPPALEDEIEIGPPRYTPPSNDSNDYFGSAHFGTPHRHQHEATAAGRSYISHNDSHRPQHPASSSPQSGFADTSFERRSSDSDGSRTSRQRHVGGGGGGPAAAYMQQQLEDLEVRNDDLYIEVEALRSKAEDDKKKDSERLRNIQREMEALKAELSMAYTRNAELEEVARQEDERKARYGSEAWKKRVHGGAAAAQMRKTHEWWNEATAAGSPMKIVLQRPPNSRLDSNELSNDDAALSSADVSLDSMGGARRRLDEDDPADDDGDDDDDGATHRAHSRLPSRDDIADAATQDRERVIVAQLLAKIRELEEANSAISARAKEFGEKAGRAFEQGERIKDDYEAVESASRMNLASVGGGHAADHDDEGDEDDEQHEGDVSHASGGGRAGDSSFSMRSASGHGHGKNVAVGDTSASSGVVIRRRAPGNRYAIEGRRTLRSAIRREKAALAELMAARANQSGSMESSSSTANATLVGTHGYGSGQTPTGMPNSISLSSISSFTSSLGSLRASSSDSSFNNSRELGGSGSGSGSGSTTTPLKMRKSALMLGRPKIRITPSCEDMAAARQEEARQKSGGWEDVSDYHGSSGRHGGAEGSEEMRDALPPLQQQPRRPGISSSRSLRRIASDGGLLAQHGAGVGESDTDNSPFTSRKRLSRRPVRVRAPAQITPSSSFNSVLVPSDAGMLGALAGGSQALTTLGSELGSEFGDEDVGAQVSRNLLAIEPAPSVTSSAASSSTRSPLKYRRPRRTRSSMNLGVNVTDDEDALSDIAELHFSRNGPSPDQSAELGADITISNALAVSAPLDHRLQLDCSPASDGVWRAEHPVVPRGALRDGEMTQYAAYDLLERAADQHPVSWADDEDFGRPITEGEARRLKLLDSAPPSQRGGAKSKGLLSWLQPTPKRKTRNSLIGAGAPGPKMAIIGEIESQEQIDERRHMSELLRQKRLGALQRAAAARRGSAFELGPGNQRFQRGGHASEDADDDEEEEDEVEARALAFSPSRQRRVKRLSLHGMPPSGEELLIPGAVRKRRSHSKLREVDLRQHQMRYESGGSNGADAGRPRPSRKQSSQSLSAYSDSSSQDGVAGSGSRGQRRTIETDEQEENFELIDVPNAVRRHRAAAGTDYYPVDLYARYNPAMVQHRVKVASNEVVTLISTWALFATVTVFAFVVAFSRGPRRVLGTPSGANSHSRRNN